MYETFKRLSNCTTQFYLHKELEELVEIYKKNDSMSVRNKVISAMFVKVFPMILKIQKKYYSLTNEQKVDHAIWHLIRSIAYYKNDGKTKFSSFYHTHLCNQMKTLLTSQSSYKNAVWQNIVADNDNVMTWYARNKASKNMELTEKFFLDNLKTSCHLSSEEKDFCACVIAGYDKMQNIADKMNVTNPIKNMNINELDLEKENKRELRRIRKIKQSIKEKIAKYGTEIFC